MCSARKLTSQGTARYVDSSVERLQVHVTGLTEGRHMVTCNGRRLPLSYTGRKDEAVAGIRYRAWQPPSALHPTIKPHSPLVFDIIDTWNGRSIGGCSYHVAHPGGRSYDVFPVNAITAESRRHSLFTNTEHTPGPIELRAEFNTLGRFFPTGHASRPDGTAARGNQRGVPPYPRPAPEKTSSAMTENTECEHARGVK